MTALTINEKRRMVLPIETVVEAVLQFDRDSAGTLWPGIVLDARIEPLPAPGLALSVRLRGGKTVERTFGLPAVAAAIINYCRQARIPLPRHGKKTLELVPEGFAFCIETTISMPRLHSGLNTGRPTEPASAPESPPETPAPGTVGGTTEGEVEATEDRPEAASNGGGNGAVGLEPQ